MTDLSQTILDQYQIRKTKKQKTRFIQLLQGHFPELKVEKGGMGGSRNLIIGDIKRAKVLLSAHYDTCAVLPVPNFNTPKRPLIAILYSLLIALPLILIILGIDALILYWTRDSLFTYLATLVAYLLLMWLMLAGPANRHTANDNTSGVITLLEIYHAMPEELRQKACIVFFDNEEKGLIGSGVFRRKYKQQMKKKLLINFDCVSDGDHIMLAANKNADNAYRALIEECYRDRGNKKILLEKLSKVYYPSDQAGFPIAVAVAALNHKKPFGYYMNKIHTRHDKVFDRENIQYLTQSTVSFISRL